MKTPGNSKLLKALVTIVVLNPVEVIVAIAYFLLSVLTYHKVLLPELLGENFLSAPVLFAIPYILNRLFPGNNIKRAIYYLSALTLIPIFLIDLSEWLYSPAYAATIVITLLVIASFRRERDNRTITETFINFASRVAASFAITLPTFLIAMAILFSTSELFEFPDKLINDSATWVMSIILILSTPILFLYASDETEESPLSAQITKIRNIICTPAVNYILTPALVIFAAIIYLYIAKIVVTFTLPNGKLAIIVNAFVISGILVKALTGITEKQIFVKFYKYLYPLFIIPLILFWLGAIQRVYEYGFTEARVYLFVSGAILTVATLMQMFKKSSLYLYLCYIAIISLSIFTFIPGISAKTIGEKSQRQELQMLEQKLNISPDTILPKEGDPNFDAALKADYNRIHNVRKYLKLKDTLTQPADSLIQPSDSLIQPSDSLTQPADSLNQPAN